LEKYLSRPVETNAIIKIKREKRRFQGEKKEENEKEINATLFLSLLQENNGNNN
jgi:hypothetical protein